MDDYIEVNIHDLLENVIEQYGITISELQDIVQEMKRKEELRNWLKLNKGHWI